MLLLIFGPAAVGKMTVGRAVCERSDFRLFHNHQTIEPLLEIFGHGTPAFETLNDEFRVRVLEEAGRAGVDLVFTFLWPLDDAGDLSVVRRYVQAYAGPVAFVELAADLATRRERNRGDQRLAAKPSKRDVEWSAAHLEELEMHVANTGGRRTLAEDLLEQHLWLRIDNTELTPDEVASRVLDRVGR